MATKFIYLVQDMSMWNLKVAVQWASHTLKIVWSEPKPSRKVKEKENKSFVAVNFKSSFLLKGGKS